MELFIGIDASPSHGSVVAIDKNGDIVDWLAWGKVKKLCNLSDKILCSPTRAAIDDKDCYRVRRNSNVYDVFNIFLDRFKDGYEVYANIEHYSMHSMSSAITVCAEVGGIIRNLLFIRDVPFIETPPTTLKLYATGKGNAKKIDMVNAFFEFYEGRSLDINNDDINDLVTINNKKNDMDGLLTDIVDATFLSRMIKDLYLIKHDEIKVNSLPPQAERVFTKTSKKYNKSYIKRPFIS